MKKALFTVTLLLASGLCNAQQFFEATNASWDNQNLSVETYRDLVITGFTETNPSTGLLAPTFKLTTISGSAVNAFYVDCPDAMYLMDFTIREERRTIVLTGMTAVTDDGTPYKMYVAEVDLVTGTLVQMHIEYNGNRNSMIPHQVILSENERQVTVVGTEVEGYLTRDNFVSIRKYGFVLGLDINDYNIQAYPPVHMDVPSPDDADYDMLENITETGRGYFISGSTNGPDSKQSLLTMGIDYSGGIIFSYIIDNSDYRMAGASVMYNKKRDAVYLLANNSRYHQFQIAECDPYTGMFNTPWVGHEITSLPVGRELNQNGFRLQQTRDNEIVIGGYLNSTRGILSEILTPYVMLLKDDLTFISVKLFGSGNNAPLSPSYFEEDGSSPFINTPDMIVYNEYSNANYLVNQNSNNGGYDLNISDLYKVSECEKPLRTRPFRFEPRFIDRAPFERMEIYAERYEPRPRPREINERLICGRSEKMAALPATGTSAVLSPNPASDQLNIKLAEGAEIGQVIIYDMKGNKVLSQDASKRAANEMTIGVGNLNMGTYMIVISTKDGMTQRERFVKN